MYIPLSCEMPHSMEIVIIHHECLWTMQNIVHWKHPYTKNNKFMLTMYIHIIWPCCIYCNKILNIIIKILYYVYMHK